MRFRKSEGLAIAGTVCGVSEWCWHSIRFYYDSYGLCLLQQSGWFGIAAKWAWNIAKFGWFVVYFSD